MSKMNILGLLSMMGVDVNKEIDKILNKVDEFKESYEWWTSLDEEVKNEIIEMSEDILGMSWEIATNFIGVKEAVKVLYDKLKSYEIIK